MDAQGRTRLGGLLGCLMLLSVVGSAAPVSDLELLEAVRSGNQEAVRSLLQQGADVNAALADGATALAWAVHRDDLQLSELLIQNGANPNAQNSLGVTPLSLACTNASSPMVRTLLSAGANPNLVLQSGETPLMTCARTGNVAAVQSLLAHGADVNAKENRRGQTALMWAVAQKHSAVTQALIKGGAELDARSNSGFTPLLFAARVGDRESAGLLLESGASVNESTPKDGSALLVASASGHEDLAIYLLDQGASPNTMDANGATPLHFAALKGLPTLGRLRYSTADSYLFRPNMMKLARELLERGANPNVQITTLAPEFSSELIWIDPVGATPFLLAAASYDTQLMRLLADNDADISLTTKDHTTALMVAAGIGQTAERSEENEQKAFEAVQLLVELGADVNESDASGQTPLHAASYIGSDRVARFLVERGADIEAVDSYGMTPVAIAEGITQGNLPRTKRIRRPHPGTADVLRQAVNSVSN